jgi:hypothetical protein
MRYVRKRLLKLQEGRHGQLPVNVSLEKLTAGRGYCLHFKTID